MRMGFLGGRRTEEPDLSARAPSLKAEMFKAEIPAAAPLFPAPMFPEPSFLEPSFPEPSFAPKPDAASVRFNPPMFERSFALPAEMTVAADIATLRDKIATSLYDASKEYQMLCSLTHSGLTSCEQLSTELRRRLAGNVHYEVLRKLDEAYALASLVRGGLPPQ
jgi:hypothetical protein